MNDKSQNELNQVPWVEKKLSQYSMRGKVFAFAVMVVIAIIGLFATGQTVNVVVDSTTAGISAAKQANENEKENKVTEADRIITKKNTREEILRLWQNGRNQEASGDFSGSLRTYVQAKELAQTVLGVDSAEYGQANNHLIGAYSRFDEIDLAVNAARESLRVLEKFKGLDHPDVANDRANLAARLFRQGKFDEATINYREATRVFSMVEKDKSKAFAIAHMHSGLSQLERAKGNDQLALEHSNLSIKFAEFAEDSSLADNGQLLANHAYLLRQLGYCLESRTYFEKANDAFANARTPESHDDYKDSLMQAPKTC
jgi:hypothetical protein